jgi:acetyl-CoA C-acetyltransferase
VSALGWYLTKHAIGVYSTTPNDRPWTPVDTAALQREVDAAAGPPLATTPSGAGTIETYTVLYDRDGTPVRGVIVGRLDADGRRFLANTPSDRALLESLTSREAIGLRGTVTPDGDTNRFELR